MADNEKQPNNEEASPLLHQPKSQPTTPPDTPEFLLGWTADGLPLGHGSVVGQPMGRAPWNSSICACLGQNDHFCSSDLEVCLLGSVAPCVLYGSNVERLGSAPGTFANHCLPYSGLYVIGNSCFGWNCLAPWFSYPSRTAIRRRFNLEGSCEALNRSCGCCGSILEDGKRAGHAICGGHISGMFGFFFTEGPVYNFADAKKSDTAKFARFFWGMLAEGVYLAPSQFEAGFTSLAHTSDDIKKTIAAAEKVFREI